MISKYNSDHIFFLSRKSHSKSIGQDVNPAWDLESRVNWFELRLMGKGINQVRKVPETTFSKSCFSAPTHLPTCSGPGLPRVFLSLTWVFLTFSWHPNYILWYTTFCVFFLLHWKSQLKDKRESLKSLQTARTSYAKKSEGSGLSWFFLFETENHKTVEYSICRRQRWNYCRLTHKRGKRNKPMNLHPKQLVLATWISRLDYCR